jgi:hypothetical protein
MITVYALLRKLALMSRSAAALFGAPFSVLFVEFIKDNLMINASGKLTKPRALFQV